MNVDGLIGVCHSSISYVWVNSEMGFVVLFGYLGF